MNEMYGGFERKKIRWYLRELLAHFRYNKYYFLRQAVLASFTNLLIFGLFFIGKKIGICLGFFLVLIAGNYFTLFVESFIVFVRRNRARENEILKSIAERKA